MRSMLILVTVLLWTDIVYAQNTRSFLHEGPIGEAKPDLDCEVGPRDPPYPVACWEGEQVVFLPAERGSVSSWREAEFALRAGNVADVVSVIEIQDGRYEVILRDHTDGKQFQRTAWFSEYSKDYRLDGVVLVSTIETARAEYLNDSLYVTENLTKLHTYDPDVDRLRDFSVYAGSKVYVKDVVVSWDSGRPLRFILRTEDDREGFTDVWLESIERFMARQAPLPPETEAEDIEERDEGDDAVGKDGVYVIVEDMPELIGGLAAIQGNIRYPESARKEGVEGRVWVQFVVDEQGNVIDPVVTRGLGAGLDEEAIRVVSMANYTPGKQRGQPVRVRMSLPITFRLR